MSVFMNCSKNMHFQIFFNKGACKEGGREILCYFPLPLYNLKEKK